MRQTRRFPLTQGGGITTLLMVSLVISMTMMDHVDAFGLVGQVAKKVFRGMTNSMSEIAEAVDGEMYANALLAQDETDSVVGETDKLLVSALPSPLDHNFSSSLIDVEFNLSEAVSPSAPPLTFPKFLTMQVFIYLLLLLMMMLCG